MCKPNGPKYFCKHYYSGDLNSLVCHHKAVDVNRECQHDDDLIDEVKLTSWRHEAKVDEHLLVHLIVYLA